MLPYSGKHVVIRSTIIQKRSPGKFRRPSAYIILLYHVVLSHTIEVKSSLLHITRTGHLFDGQAREGLVRQGEAGPHGRP